MPAIRGAHRWIPFPFFQVQSSEFGKVLLIIALAAFAVDRSRRLHERSTTARIMLLALLPAMIVIAAARPRHGPGVRRRRVHDPVLRRHLVEAAHCARRDVRRRGRRSCSPSRPAIGVHVLKPYQVQRLTGFLNPSRDPQQPDLQHPAVGDRDRLRAEDRPRRRERDPDEPALPAREPDRLHLRRGRRDATASSAPRWCCRCTRC